MTQPMVADKDPSIRLGRLPPLTKWIEDRDCPGGRNHGIIFRYLIGTADLGLWYPRGGSSFELVGYSDADFAGCKVDRKSTSGTCQFVGSALISWASKKQNSVALSTAESEYIAAGSCVAQVLWLKQQLLDRSRRISRPNSLS